MNETRAIIRAFDEALDQNCALATVVSVAGSAYRRPGARMLVLANGASAGTVSAGCLEADVIAHAQRVAETGMAKLVEYDTSSTNDEMAWGLGLGCNGVVRVLVEPLVSSSSSIYLDALRRSLDSRSTAAIATVFRHTSQGAPVAIGSRCIVDEDAKSVCDIDDAELADSIERDAHQTQLEGVSSEHVYETESGIATVFIEALAPPVPLVVFGAGIDALPVVELAANLGFLVEVVDPQMRAASYERFARADKVTLAQPRMAVERIGITSRTLALLMTHNYDHDRALLETLLASKARYIGLLGPRKRSERMLRDLAADGVVVTEDDHARMFAPAGLDIGADSAQEIALAIIAEMRAVLASRDGGYLRARTAPIHDAQCATLHAAAIAGARAANHEAKPAPIGVLLLAAGASRRLGVPKQLLPFEGESLLRRAALAALAANCGPVVVVLGAHRESVENEIADLPLEIVVNEQWGTGMAASIRVGMERLAARIRLKQAETEAVVVMLCDQPRVDADLIAKLVAIYRTGNAPVVASRYNGTHGVPALFDRRLYPALLSLTGSQGAKNVIRDHAAQLIEVVAPEAAYDIDTIADYQRLCANEPGAMPRPA